MTKRVIITAIIVTLSFLAFFLIGAEQIAGPEQTSIQQCCFVADDTSIDRQEACRLGNYPLYLLALAFFVSVQTIKRIATLVAKMQTTKHTPTQLLQYTERLTRAPNARTA